MSESRSISALNAATAKTNQNQQQQDKNTKTKEPYRLYVGGLNYSTTTAMLRKAFEEYGKVLDGTEVICDRSGNSKGFGFVNFEEESSMEKAKEKMNNSELDGRKIQVTMAQPEKKFNNRDSSKMKGQRSNYQNHTSFRGYRIRIQNLPPNITWRELKDFLRQAGEVKYADISSPGVGIGEFGSSSERMNVIKALNGKELRGSKIRMTILNESDMHYGHPSSYGMHHHHHHHGPNSHFFSEPFPPFGPGYDMSYGPGGYEPYGYGPPIEYNPHHHHHPVPFGPQRVNFWGRNVSGPRPMPPPPYTSMSPFSHTSFTRGNSGNGNGGVNGSNSNNIGNQGRINEMRSGWRHYGNGGGAGGAGAGNGGSNMSNHGNLNGNNMYNGYGNNGNGSGGIIGNGGPIRSYSNRNHNHTPYRRFYDRSGMRGYMNGMNSNNNGLPSANTNALPLKDYEYDNMMDDFPKINNNTNDMGYDDKMHFDRNISGHYIGFNHMNNAIRGNCGSGGGGGGGGGSYSNNFNDGSGHIDPPLPRTLHGSGAYDRMPKEDWNALSYGCGNSSGYNGMNAFSENTSRYSRYDSHNLHNMKNNMNDRNYPNYSVMSTATAPVPPAPPLPPSQQQPQNQTSVQNHNSSSAPLDNHRHSNGGNIGTGSGSGGGGGGGGGGANSQAMSLEDRRNDYHHHHHHEYTTRERSNSGYKQSVNSNGPTYDYTKIRSASNTQYSSKERIDNTYSRGGSRSEMVTHMDGYSQNRREHDYGSKNDSMRYSTAANTAATATEHKTGREGRDMEYYSLSDRRPDYNSSSSRNYRDDEMRTAGGVDRHRRPSHRVTPYNR